MGESKPFLNSKTVWANLALAIAAQRSLVFAHWLSANPQNSILALALLNCGLRAISKDAVHFFKPK